MRFIDYVSSHRLSALILATLALQVSVLGSGLYLRSSLARPSVPSRELVGLSVSKAVDPISHKLTAAAVSAEPTTADFETDVAPPQPAQVIAPDSIVPPVGERGVSYRVKSGDTLTKIWVDNGGSYQGALKAAKALESSGVSVASIQVGDELELTIKADGSDVIGLRKKLSEGRVLILVGSSEQGYSSQIVQRKIVETKRIVSGEILNSLAQTAAALNIPNQVTDDLVDLFSARIEFSRDIHPGDSFSVIFSERQTEDGEPLEPGEIVAASLKSRGEMLAAMRYAGKAGEARYFDEQGEPLGNFFLRYPVKFSRISSVFSGSRFHPVLKVSRPHNGVDFSAPTGTPVRSVADGVVVSSSYNGGSGKMVKIRHSEKYSSAYLHLSTINVKKGARVKRGDVIGKVGQTGLATGPHLHYSFYVNGRYVDPMAMKLPAMPTKFEVIPVDYRQALLEALEQAHQTVQVAGAGDSANVLS